MSENNYFFVIDTGYDTSLFFYKNFQHLLEIEQDYMKNNDDWFIIEGKIIRRGSDKNVV